jgi:hypothetical protein
VTTNLFLFGFTAIVVVIIAAYGFLMLQIFHVRNEILRAIRRSSPEGTLNSRPSSRDPR